MNDIPLPEPGTIATRLYCKEARKLRPHLCVKHSAVKKRSNINKQLGLVYTAENRAELIHHQAKCHLAARDEFEVAAIWMAARTENTTKHYECGNQMLTTIHRIMLK